MMIVRLIVSIIAIVMIVIGFVTMISPIPFGIILILLGLVLLTLADPHSRPILKWIRKRWPWLDRLLANAQEHTPPIISEPLKETEPEKEEPSASKPEPTK